MQGFPLFPFTSGAGCAIITEQSFYFCEVIPMSDLTGKFVLKAPYKPSGDQPQAIEALAAGVQQGMDARCCWA